MFAVYHHNNNNIYLIAKTPLTYIFSAINTCSSNYSSSDDALSVFINAQIMIMLDRNFTTVIEFMHGLNIMMNPFACWKLRRKDRTKVIASGKKSFPTIRH